MVIIWALSYGLPLSPPPPDFGSRHYLLGDSSALNQFNQLHTLPAEQGKEGSVGTVALLNGLHVTLGVVRVLDIGELHAVDGLRGQPGIDGPDLLHVIARVLRHVADQGVVVARDRIRGLQNIFKPRVRLWVNGC